MTLSKKAAASTPRRNSSRFAAISSTSLAIHVEHNLAPPRVGIPNRHRGRIQRVDLGAGQVAHEYRFTWHDTVRRVSEGSEAECLLGDEGAVDRRGGLLTGHPVVIALKRSRASTRKRGEPEPVLSTSTRFCARVSLGRSARLFLEAHVPGEHTVVFLSPGRCAEPSSSTVASPTSISASSTES